MKKLFLSLFVILGLFIITGCGCSKNNALFVIKDKEFRLDTDKEFEGLKYKTSADFREINNTTYASKYVQYNYQPEDSSNYFYFRIFYFKGKDIEYARKDFGIEEKFKFQDGKTDNIEYKMIDEERTDGTIHFYFITRGNDTFVLHFVSQNDIKDFETKALNSIKF